ncbi:hypothetical protein [Flavobacterium cheongpyeongense]|jgi:hypothetical protein|nr:hypothetical protein [Flavobacterium cheongpyeongense]
MKKFVKKSILLFFAVISLGNAQDKVESKQLYIPEKVWLVPENNN